MACSFALISALSLHKLGVLIYNNSTTNVLDVHNSLRVMFVNYHITNSTSDSWCVV